VNRFEKRLGSRRGETERGRYFSTQVSMASVRNCLLRDGVERRICWPRTNHNQTLHAKHGSRMTATEQGVEQMAPAGGRGVAAYASSSVHPLRGGRNQLRIVHSRRATTAGGAVSGGQQTEDDKAPDRSALGGRAGGRDQGSNGVLDGDDVETGKATKSDTRGREVGRGAAVMTEQGLPCTPRARSSRHATPLSHFPHPPAPTGFWGQVKLPDESGRGTPSTSASRICSMCASLLRYTPQQGE